MTEEVPNKNLDDDSGNFQQDASQVDAIASSDSTEEASKAMDSEALEDADQINIDNENNTDLENKSEVETQEATETLDNDARLRQLETEHETLKSQYMRIAADFDNFRKRQTRDQDDLRLQLTCNTLSSILPVVDNFERARQQLDPQGEEAQALHRSYQGLYKQLVEVLKQLGVAPMRVVGQSFDPTLHEAVLREPSEEHQEDLITEELQRGYHLNGRVLRHALVKVSMGPGSNNSKNDENLEKSSSEPSIENNSSSLDSES